MDSQRLLARTCPVIERSVRRIDKNFIMVRCSPQIRLSWTNSSFKRWSKTIPRRIKESRTSMTMSSSKESTYHRLKVSTLIQARDQVRSLRHRIDLGCLTCCLSRLLVRRQRLTAHRCPRLSSGITWSFWIISKSFRCICLRQLNSRESIR